MKLSNEQKLHEPTFSHSPDREFGYIMNKKNISNETYPLLVNDTNLLSSNPSHFGCNLIKENVLPKLNNRIKLKHLMT